MQSTEMILIQLLPSTAQAEAESLLLHGGMTNSWETLEYVVKLARERGIDNIQFYRWDPERTARGVKAVLWKLDEMETMITSNLECRPHPPGLRHLADGTHFIKGT